jgi:hypothetical protein
MGILFPLPKIFFSPSVPSQALFFRVPDSPLFFLLPFATVTEIPRGHSRWRVLFFFILM